jgi:hypothetical protein
MKITLQELERAIDAVLKSQTQWGIEDVDIPYDFYWTFTIEERLDLSTKPKHAMLGSIDHDWERLQAIVQDVDRGGPYALPWLAAILEAFGEVASGHVPKNPGTES